MATYSVLIRSGVRGATGPAGPSVNHVSSADDSLTEFDLTVVDTVFSEAITAGVGSLVEVNFTGELVVTTNDSVNVVTAITNGTIYGSSVSGGGFGGVNVTKASSSMLLGGNSAVVISIQGVVVPASDIAETTFKIMATPTFGTPVVHWREVSCVLRSVTGTYTGA